MVTVKKPLLPAYLLNRASTDFCPKQEKVSVRITVAKSNLFIIKLIWLNKSVSRKTYDTWIHYNKTRFFLLNLYMKTWLLFALNQNYNTFALAIKKGFSSSSDRAFRLAEGSWVLKKNGKLIQ